MHQVSLETICPLKAFQLHYCPDDDAKSIVKHFIFLHKFSVLGGSHHTLVPFEQKQGADDWMDIRRR